MNSNKRLLLLALLIFIVTGSTVLNLYAQGQDEDFSSLVRLHNEILLLATKCRYAPLTQVSVPTGEKQHWMLFVMQRTQEQYVFSYVPSEEKKAFLIQALLCKKDKSATFYDATFLGSKESAEEFYKCNYEYFTSLKPSEYLDCLAPFFMFTSSKWVRLEDGTTKSIYESHDRAILFCCGWIRHFAAWEEEVEMRNRSEDVSEQEREKSKAETREKSDDVQWMEEFSNLSEEERARLAEEYSQRKIEFLMFVIKKQSDRFVELWSERELSSLASRVKFFDRYFPFAVFNTPLTLGEKQREQCKKFFETTLYIRNRLRVLDAKFADTIARDKKIINALSKL